MIRILAIGDITSPGGLEHLCRNLWDFRKENRVDFCVVNGENASVITGINGDNAKRLLLHGADVITGGNHTLRQKAAYAFLDESDAFLRPVNFGAEAPGKGYTILKANGYSILVINAMGNVHMEPNLDAPFDYVERVLKREAGRFDVSVLDLHAEATGEKLALAHFFDGRITAVFGTHTHVPTADEQILPGGTGYISDVGMCGESGGILGMDKDGIIARMRSHLPLRMDPAPGVCVANCVIFDVDPASGKTVAVRRISF